MSYPVNLLHPHGFWENLCVYLFFEKEPQPPQQLYQPGQESHLHSPSTNLTPSPPLPLPSPSPPSSYVPSSSNCWRIVYNQLADPQHRIRMLTLHRLDPPLPSLRLLLLPQRLARLLDHHRTALKQALVDIRIPLHSVVPAPEHARMRDPQRVPDIHLLQSERQPDEIPNSDQERELVDMDCDVLRRLGLERSQERERFVG